MVTTATVQQRIWTEEALMALPDDGCNHEVVDGELVMSPKNNFQHERICGNLYTALRSFNTRHKLGLVIGSNAGFWMNNRNCRAPDVSFISRARLEEAGFSPNSKQFFPGAPDLAIEVLSPGNSREEINERLRDFFSSGTQIVWIIDPETESAEICRSLTQRRLLGPGGELDGEDLLPGLRVPLKDLFKEWDWD